MNRSNDPYRGLPPHPTIGEIIAEIGEVASQNLAKVTLTQRAPQEDDSDTDQ
ncbi:MAG TPA: hypothetical protein VL481_03820 [Verrucomicrobiae bacterium]|nr:hypothetical protein [Verrucomicrobiae bacterium]